MKVSTIIQKNSYRHDLHQMAILNKDILSRIILIYIDLQSPDALVLQQEEEQGRKIITLVFLARGLDLVVICTLQ